MKTLSACYGSNPTPPQSTAAFVNRLIFALRHGALECTRACKNMGIGYSTPGSACGTYSYDRTVWPECQER